MRYLYLLLIIGVVSGCAVEPHTRCQNWCTDYVNEAEANGESELGFKMHTCLLKCAKEKYGD